MISSRELLSPQFVESAWRDKALIPPPLLRFRRYWQSWLPVATLTIVVANVVGVGMWSGLYSGVGTEALEVLGIFLGFWVVVLGGAFVPSSSSGWRRISMITAFGVVLGLAFVGWQGCRVTPPLQSVPPTSPILRGFVPEFRAVVSQGMNTSLWRSKGEASKDPAESEAVVRDRVSVRTKSAQIGWAATTFLVIVAGIGVIVASLYVTLSSSLVGQGVRLRGLLAVALFVGGLLCWALHYDYNVAPPLLGELLESVFVRGAGELAYAKTLTRIMNAMALVAISLVTLALCIMLSASADPMHQNVSVLALQMRWEQILLYVSAAALTLGGREISMLYTWPSAWFPEAIAKDIERLASAAATGGGVVLSIVLLAIFVPAELVLRARARVLARSANPQGTAKEHADWLAARDLAGLDFKSFTTLGAVLGPVLASGPLSVVLKGVGG